MGIQGCQFWNDRNVYFAQENNPTEQILRARLGGKGWLETCGPTAAVNCLAAMGELTPWTTPGGYSPQPEQELMDHMTDPRNWEKFRKAWGGEDPQVVPGNEVAQWYPVAIQEVLGTKCWFWGELALELAIKHVQAGRAIQVCLKNPGHFVALVAYDSDRGEFIINDSWSGRWPSGSGWNQRLSKTEYDRNVKPKSLICYQRERAA